MKLLTVTLAAVSLVAISSADLKSEITLANGMITKAMMKGDMKALESVLRASVTSDFKYTEAGRTMNFDQMWTTMKASMSSMKCTMAKATETMVKEKGKMGTSVEMNHMMGTMMGADKKQHTMTFDGTSNNTYMKVGKQWKMSKMVVGKSSMMMDGKPMDMSKMGGGK